MGGDKGKRRGKENWRVEKGRGGVEIEGEENRRRRRMNWRREENEEGRR